MQELVSAALAEDEPLVSSPSSPSSSSESSAASSPEETPATLVTSAAYAISDAAAAVNEEDAQKAPASISEDISSGGGAGGAGAGQREEEEEEEDSFDWSEAERADDGEAWTFEAEMEAIRRLATGRLVSGAELDDEAAARIQALIEQPPQPQPSPQPSPQSSQTGTTLTAAASPTWNGHGPDYAIAQLAKRARTQAHGPPPHGHEMTATQAAADVATVAAGYNALPNKSREERDETRIRGVRDYNNLVKRALIEQYARGAECVLDLCCGKGGDLHKWTAARPRLVVFVDIAEHSVAECRTRYEQARRGGGGRATGPVPAFDARFAVADCFQSGLERVLPAGVQYDVVSCQMALHYSFSTAACANSAMKNVARCLRPGGYFLCTLPNADELYRRVCAAHNAPFGNSLYRVEFDRHSYPPFGARYKFWLAEAVENLPEYLVSRKILCELAEFYGLELVLTDTFEHYVAARAREDPALAARASRLAPTPEEREVITLYCLYVFRKVR